MAQQTDHVFIYCYTDDVSDQGSVEEDGVTIRKFYLPRWAWQLNCLYIPSSFRAVLRENRDALDVVILTGGFVTANTPVAHTLTEAGIPYVFSPNAAFNPFTFHGLKALKKGVYERLFEKYVVEHAAALRLLSAVQIEHFERRGYDLCAERLFIVKEGVDWEKIQEETSGDGAPPARSFSENTCVFGFLGRLSVYTKGLDILLQAWSIYTRSGGTGRLQFVGPDASGSTAYLKALSRRLGLAGVTFSPPKYGADKFRFLEQISVFVHPSRHEGIPRTVREALAVGCPVILTDNTNIHDMVAEHDAGYVAKLDPEDLAKQMLAFSARYEREKEHFRAAALKVAALLNWDAIARQYLQEVEIRLKNKAHPSEEAVLSRACSIGFAR